MAGRSSTACGPLPLTSFLRATALHCSYDLRGTNSVPNTPTFRTTDRRIFISASLPPRPALSQSRACDRKRASGERCIPRTCGD
jgi:hypothetical protein